MTRELLQQALAALENPALPVYTTLRKEIRMALAAPMPEPVAYGMQDEHGVFVDAISPEEQHRYPGEYKTPLYAAPPAAPAPALSPYLHPTSTTLAFTDDAPALVVPDFYSRQSPLVQDAMGIAMVKAWSVGGRTDAVNPDFQCGFEAGWESAAPVVREPLTFEQRRAVQEAHCSNMTEAYFFARPQLDDKIERRIYEAGFNAGFSTGYGIGGGGK